MEKKEPVGSHPRFWEHTYDAQSPDPIAPSTATVVEDKTIMMVSSGDEPSFAGSQNLTVAVLVPHSESGWETGIARGRAVRKLLFRHVPGPRLLYLSGRYPLIYEVLEEDIGTPDDVVSSIPPWPKLWHLEQVQPTDWRGAFFPTYHQKVLFSKIVTLETAKLPRWKPNIIIQQRTLESVDD